jgi:hypothetical protein
VFRRVDAEQRAGGFGRLAGEAGSEPAAPLVDLHAGLDDVGVVGEGVEVARAGMGERTAASVQVHLRLLEILQEGFGVEIDLRHAGDRVRLGFNHLRPPESSAR